ncbi:hypothetical protein UK12_24025 [Saccharothrix sp. ST-888]|nr:hypothetical protein UK12_24025 [Saccharothrix sp. ST-888]
MFGAVGMAVLLRQRDRAAKQAAEVAANRRLVAEERHEEQLAEAEYAAEVAEERATRFGRRLTAEKARLAKAETEIARLLRERAVAVAEQALKEAEAARLAHAATVPKYPASPAAFVRAAAVLRHLECEAERAEARRDGSARAQLALRPKAQAVPASAAGAAGASSAREAAAEAATAPGTATGAARLVPAAAVAPTVPALPAAPAGPGAAVVPVPTGLEARLAPAAASGTSAVSVSAAAKPAAPVVPGPVRPAPAVPQPGGPEPVMPQPRVLGGAVLPRALGAAGTAAQAGAAVPAVRQRPRPQGAGRSAGFSFFGRPGAVRPAAPVSAAGGVAELGERAELADLADVVGDEAVAESARYAVPGAGEAAAETAGQDVREPEGRPDHARPEVVDLTPHDETEYLELPELRADQGRQR